MFLLNVFIKLCPKSRYPRALLGILIDVYIYIYIYIYVVFRRVFALRVHFLSVYHCKLELATSRRELSPQRGGEQATEVGGFGVCYGA